MNLLKQRLFWKILLIFWLTTIAIIVANIYITKQIAFNEFKTKHLRSTMQTLAVDAVEIYEEHGRKALNKWYRKQAKQHQIKVVLLDGNEIPVASRNTHHPDKGFKLENNDRNDFSNHLLKMADQHVLSASGIPYILRLLPSPYLHSKFNPEALHAYRILASFLIISIGSFWIAYSIARPIQILREASNKISLGKFDTNVRKDIGNRKDELGMLAQAFDNMSSKIYELLEKQKRLFTQSEKGK